MASPLYRIALTNEERQAMLAAIRRVVETDGLDEEVPGGNVLLTALASRLVNICVAAD